VFQLLSMVTSWLRFSRFARVTAKTSIQVASKPNRAFAKLAGSTLLGAAALYASSPCVRTETHDDEDLRLAARRIFSAGCRAVDPKIAMLNALKLEGDILTVAGDQVDISKYDEVFVLGAGKASIGMAEGVQEILGDKITKGIIVTKYGHAVRHVLCDKFEVFEASHPTPDESGVEATRRLLELAERANDRSLVLCCISGGSSSLLVAPAEGILLENMTEATRQLLGCGCPIEEKNAVLKHLSRVKGGQLLATAQPAKVVTMVLSDVVGDPLGAIGSGPTVPDSSTYVDCLKTLGAFHIFDTFPKPCLERLVRGAAGLVTESPKPTAPIFTDAITTVVAGNKTAVDAAVSEAKLMGFNTLALSTFMEGEASEIAKVFSAIAKEEVKYNRPVPLPACVVVGGETTVTLPPKPGVGGRNQLLALSAAVQIRGLQGVALLAGGTDGGDGPKNDSAGAVVIGSDAADAETAGLDPNEYLELCDAYSFFRRYEDAKYGRHNILHLRDGPTGTNVADLTILLIR